MQYELSNPTVIKELLSTHGKGLSKALGQNFLINPAVCPRMAELSGAADNICVLEIGPGIGVLTVELAKRAKKVVCIELDSSLIPILNETLSDFNNVRLINADVMKTDLESIIDVDFSGSDTVICANLPYYITSPVIMRLLESRIDVKSITVMVQKEAARRLCAEPGSREAGAVSYAVSYFASPHILFDVSAGSFLPPPKVDSSVIKLDILKEPPVKVADEKLMFKTIRAAFRQRRKTLLNALSSGMNISKGIISEAIISAGLPLAVRGERITLKDFGAISDYLKNHGI